VPPLGIALTARHPAAVHKRRIAFGGTWLIVSPPCVNVSSNKPCRGGRNASPCRETRDFTV